MAVYPIRLSEITSNAFERFERGAPYEDVFGPLTDKATGLLFYPGIEAFFDIYAAWAERFSDVDDAFRLHLEPRILSGECPEILEETIQAERSYLTSSGDQIGRLLALFVSYYRNGLLVETFITELSFRRLYPECVTWDRSWLWKTPNFGFVRQSTERAEADDYVILCRQVSDKERIFHELLESMGKNAKIISTEDALWEQQLQSCRDNSSNDGVILLGETAVLYQVSILPNFRREWKVLTGNRRESHRWSLGWYGSYLSYISQIYGEDCEVLFRKSPSKRFSVVIPARNSAVTLRHTIRTCLEQSYSGEYEIIISDNSTGQNADVYALCKELNDPRIRYLKTPRDLHLPKSFEFAILHAEGEYIVPIGSDDGLLPWALEFIDGIATAYPEEEVIQWERGFYAWPGFNGGQQHQLIIPRDYSDGEIPVFYRDSRDYLASVLVDPRNMYALPMLYINSCFKRSYMQTILEKTGSLWDGMCQDIYMGVITACIMPRVLNLTYPLSIAGMSSGSVGANANNGQKTDEEFRAITEMVYQDGNIGGYWYSYHEILSPEIGMDVSTLYACLLRAVSIGVLPEIYLTQVFDWKKMFMNLYRGLDIRDVCYDRKIHQLLYAAMQHGEDFEAWFREKIYEPALIPRELDETTIDQRFLSKSYTSGERNADGGITLDASEYGVSDIHGAVRLFAEMMDHMSDGEV